MPGERGGCSAASTNASPRSTGTTSLTSYAAAISTSRAKPAATSSRPLAHSTSTSYVLIEMPAGSAPVALRWDLSVHDIVWTVFIDAQGRMVATERAPFRSYADLTAAIERHLGVSP